VVISHLCDLGLLSTETCMSQELESCLIGVLACIRKCTALMDVIVKGSGVVVSLSYTYFATTAAKTRLSFFSYFI